MNEIHWCCTYKYVFYVIISRNDDAISFFRARKVFQKEEFHTIQTYEKHGRFTMIFKLL